MRKSIKNLVKIYQEFYREYKINNFISLLYLNLFFYMIVNYILFRYIYLILGDITIDQLYKKDGILSIISENREAINFFIDKKLKKLEWIINFHNNNSNYSYRINPYTSYFKLFLFWIVEKIPLFLINIFIKVKLLLLYIITIILYMIQIIITKIISIFVYFGILNFANLLIICFTIYISILILIKFMTILQFHEYIFFLKGIWTTIKILILSYIIQSWLSGLINYINIEKSLNFSKFYKNIENFINDPLDFIQIQDTNLHIITKEIYLFDHFSVICVLLSIFFIVIIVKLYFQEITYLWINKKYSNKYYSQKKINQTLYNIRKLFILMVIIFIIIFEFLKSFLYEAAFLQNFVLLLLIWEIIIFIYIYIYIIEK